MPKPIKNSTVWRENRKRRTGQQDTEKTRKADRMRWYRAKRASFKKANDIFVDGLDTGCDRRVYVLVMTTKQSKVRYATYDSHPELQWIPPVEDVVRTTLSLASHMMLTDVLYYIDEPLAQIRDLDPISL